MSDLLLGSDDDLVFVGGDLVFTTGIKTVSQMLLLRLSAFREEWFANLDYGLEEFRGEKWSIDRVTSAIRKVIIETPGVDSIVSLNVAFVGSTRTIVTDWEIKSGEEYSSGSLDI